MLKYWSYTYLHCSLVWFNTRCCSGRLSCVLRSRGVERSRLQCLQWPVGVRVHPLWNVHRLHILPFRLSLWICL